MSNEGQPGWTTGVLSRPIVAGENPSNNVFVDGDVESQGNLLSDSRATPGGIALLHLDNSVDEFFVGSVWSGLYAGAWMKRAGDIFGSSEPGGGPKESKASARLLNESGGRGE